MICLEELLDKLRSYCNWNSLPRDLLSSAVNSRGASTSGTDRSEDALLTAFLLHLTSLVPFQWSVVQQPVFAGGTSTSSSAGEGSCPQAMMHAQAVGTTDGIMCFGGLRLGRLQEVRVENEASWIKESMPAGLAPDCSRVYQGTSSQASNQVVKVEPSSSAAGAPWAAQAASPALDAGLLGHSVAVWGSRAFIFGGMREGKSQQPEDANAPVRPTNMLRAYALDEAGTQGGLLPLLSDVPQLGAVPKCRMYHSAAVDPVNGVMYVYGGVSILQRNNTRVPADNEAGLLHAFDFATFTWSAISTTGDCRPHSTTLLAFFWHDGALWAIPDLPSSDGGRRAAKAVAAGYQLLRLCLDSKQWERVKCEGQAPGQRTDACSMFNPVSKELVVYGGRSCKPPFCLLADLHMLAMPTASQQQQKEPEVQQENLPPQQQQQQQQQALLLQPVWQQVQPSRLSAVQGAAGSSQAQQQQQQGMLPLAGHSGGVVSSTGEAVFVGGYRRNDIKEPQPLLQVVAKAVRAPTPDVAKLALAVPQTQQAMQHVRMQLARLVKKSHPAQVLLKPEGAGVRLPARLLALYSSLFDDLFQGMLEEQEEQEPAGQQQQQQPVQVVPVPGVQQDSIAAVCRWMMGLMALQGCGVAMLVDMYRVADRLVMEQLMVEVLQELAERQLTPQEASLVMHLAGDFPGAGQDIHRNAAQQLQQQVSVATAPAIMALARQHSNRQLEEACVQVMSAHRKNDVFAVLDFAVRFNLRSLQGSCLGSLRRLSRDRLVDKADRVMQVVKRHLLPGQRACDVAAAKMLERDLVNEVEGAELQSLSSYAAVCERLHLHMLWQGIVDYCSRDDVWQLMHQQVHKDVLQQLRQRHARLHTAIMQQRGAGGRAPMTTRDAADAATNLLSGTSRPTGPNSS